MMMNTMKSNNISSGNEMMMKMGQNNYGGEHNANNINNEYTNNNVSSKEMLIKKNINEQKEMNYNLFNFDSDILNDNSEKSGKQDKNNED